MSMDRCRSIREPGFAIQVHSSRLHWDDSNFRPQPQGLSIIEHRMDEAAQFTLTPTLSLRERGQLTG